MNTYKLTTLSLLLTLSLTTSYSQSAEVEISKVLQAEMKFADEHSIAEVVQQFWILDENTLLHLSTEEGVVRSINKEALLTMTEPPLYTTVTRTITNQKVYVNENTAIVSHDKLTELEDGKKITSLEIKYLEKIDGVWKIHAASVQAFSTN